MLRTCYISKVISIKRLHLVALSCTLFKVSAGTNFFLQMGLTDPRKNPKSVDQIGQSTPFDRPLKNM